MIKPKLSLSEEPSFLGATLLVAAGVAFVAVPTAAVMLILQMAGRG